MLYHLAILFFLLAGLRSAQTAEVKLKVLVAVDDRDLTQRTQPRSPLQFSPQSWEAPHGKLTSGAFKFPYLFSSLVVLFVIDANFTPILFHNLNH